MHHHSLLASPYDGSQHGHSNNALSATTKAADLFRPWLPRILQSQKTTRTTVTVHSDSFKVYLNASSYK